MQQLLKVGRGWGWIGEKVKEGSGIYTFLKWLVRAPIRALPT